MNHKGCCVLPSEHSASGAFRARDWTHSVVPSWTICRLSISTRNRATDKGYFHRNLSHVNGLPCAVFAQDNSGAITVAMLAKIRRMFLREHLPVRETFYARGA